MQIKQRIVLIAALLAAAAVGIFLWLRPHNSNRTPDDPQVAAKLETIITSYRRVIVLMDGAADLDEATRARCRNVGRKFFWEKQSAIKDLNESLKAEPKKIQQLIDYVTSSKLRDADRLAFLEVFEDLRTLPAAPAGVKTELDDLHSIQNTYREEVTKIFSQFATRGGNAVREKWSTYVAWLRTFLNRDALLKQFDDGTTDAGVLAPPAHGSASPKEVSGLDFAPKTVALTFDDGPHPVYTEEVTALLQKYGIRAAFFEVGRNLGTVDQDGKVTLSKNAEISKRLVDAGHMVANHTYSHRVLPKLSEEDRTKEIETTNLLLEKALGQKPQLFRPPYGARNKEVLAQINGEGMENVMWTIDSEDWADPIPESIAMRVLHELDQSHKGIILFHDIHKQGVLALPMVLDELQRQGYTFLAFDANHKLVKSEPPLGGTRSNDPPPAPAQTVTGDTLHPYRQSWAVVIGINDYQNWPKLRYAVNDANAIEQMLVNKFGFKHDNIFKLTDGEATRQRIMQVLGDELTNSSKVSHDDRVFFFFAGHGATREMGNNRQIGFIIPVDADKTNYYATAVSMSEIRDAADLIPAKHVYFVMDSCYSGLALTRGGGMQYNPAAGYLEEVTSRVARQILTAGGSNQEVADDGPNGHSVFTWALLEGLDGKADLDHNGVITASELGAYVSPVVTSFSHQTPVMGNLIGSEGGEFVFELKPEPLTPLTQQFEGKSLELNKELTSLDTQIASKQAELLKLQQSVEEESAKLSLMRGGNPAPAPMAPKPNAQAYDLDRAARGYYREKKYDEAAKALEQAVALKPNDAVLLNNLGFVYFEMGRYTDAVTYLEKTLTIDPNRKEAHGNLAYAELKLGKKTEAKTHFERYLELFPNSPKATEVRQILATL